MLSRAAETIYWMGRYLERTENQARLISVNSHLLLDLPDGISPGWRPLITITGTNEGFSELYSDFNEKNVRKYLIDDSRSQASLLSIIRNARESARTIRDAIPREIWEQINVLYLHIKENSWKAHDSARRYSFLKDVILLCQQISGMFTGTMNQDITAAFLSFGRDLERADMTSRIIDVRSTDLLEEKNANMSPFNTIQWMGVLKSLSAYQMYRLEKQVEITRKEVLDFLFLSDVFPRSITYCLQSLKVLCAVLPTHSQADVLAEVEKTRALLTDKNIRDLKHEALELFIDELQIGFMGIANVLAKNYFLSMRTEKQAQGL